MSRAAPPFGPDQPGRLQATMLKVLAAEISDPGRLLRGKRCVPKTPWSTSSSDTARSRRWYRARGQILTS